jgi:hypothetical protein
MQRVPTKTEEEPAIVRRRTRTAQVLEESDGDVPPQRSLKRPRPEDESKEPTRKRKMVKLADEEEKK